MKLHPILAAAALAPLLHAAPDIFPLKDVRAGQHGIGRTVFAGNRIEEFQVEILGVLENIGPRQSIILARLSGGPLADTGVMQGMSGSPVYIDGKLVGAVALGFSEAKDAIAGIRPIEEMLRVEPRAPDGSSPPLPRRAPASSAAECAWKKSPRRLRSPDSPRRRSNISRRSFASWASIRGKAFPAAANPADALGDPSTLEPGSMISVQLISGDMTVGADGTVTAIDGDRIYAFGHRFLATGPTDLPFAQRRSAGAAAESVEFVQDFAGARNGWAPSQPIAIRRFPESTGRRAHRSRRWRFAWAQNTYRMQLVQDRVMTPLVAQMAVFSAIDSTERSVGAATYSVRGQLDFEGGTVQLDNVYSGDVGDGGDRGSGRGDAARYALHSGFDALRLKSITLDIDAGGDAQPDADRRRGRSAAGASRRRRGD